MFTEPYAKLYDLLHYHKPYKHEVDFVYNWGRMPKKILDLGCGTASYWRHYPKEVKIFGVEKSEAMINQSRYKDRIFNHDINHIEGFFKGTFDVVTAMFDVLNYLENHDWWEHLPLERGGYFIFDIWDKEKIIKEGFLVTANRVNEVTRSIVPIEVTENKVKFNVRLDSSKDSITESHTMYLHSFDDILDYAFGKFDIVDVQRTERWQTWFKLRRK